MSPDVESQALRDPEKSLAFKAKEFYQSYKLQMLLAEALGAGTLTFWGCMACIDWWGMPGAKKMRKSCGNLNFKNVLKVSQSKWL